MFKVHLNSLASVMIDEIDGDGLGGYEMQE
jgi:hypothetical protein